MTVEQQIAQLSKELKAQRVQEANLNNWLINNYNSPLRQEIISDKNALSVKIKTTEFKISNLEKRLPILGFEIPESVTKQQSDESKKRKTI